MGLKAIKGGAHRMRAHLYLGQQKGNINNACWDRSHGQGIPPGDGTPQRWDLPPEMGPPSADGTPLEMGPPGDGTPRDGTPPKMGPPRRWDPPSGRWNTPRDGTPLEMESSGEYRQMIRKL